MLDTSQRIVHAVSLIHVLVIMPVVTNIAFMNSLLTDPFVPEVLLLFTTHSAHTLNFIFSTNLFLPSVPVSQSCNDMNY